MENENTHGKHEDSPSNQDNQLGSTPDIHKKDEVILSDKVGSVNLNQTDLNLHQNKDDNQETKLENISYLEYQDTEVIHVTKKAFYEEMEIDPVLKNPSDLEYQDCEVIHVVEEVFYDEKEIDPVLDRPENPGIQALRSSSAQSSDPDQDAHAYGWPVKAVALKNFIKEKGAVAVSSVFRRLSGRRGEDEDAISDQEEENDCLAKGSNGKEESGRNSKSHDNSGEQFAWNPLSFIKIVWDTDMRNKTDQAKDVHVEFLRDESVIKGRIIVYTRLSCQESKEVRLFMRQKRLKYIEINIDVYPSRRNELEKNTGCSLVPCIYFNDLVIGGLPELKALDESDMLDEKIRYVVNEEPSPAAPLPPLPGEDDASGSGMVDELAVIVRKMKKSITLRDRFYKMRMFNNCFLGSEAIDFLSEDQYLEREEAVEFGRKLADKHFFQHVLDESTLGDDNHLYRFLEHDPIILCHCYNIPRGILDVKPKPITEIASRLRFLSHAIFEAYVSEDGRHVDYRSIHGSEEFKRFLRIIEELHRVELEEMSREEKLSFFINLYNMMTIHVILTWGYPVGALDRRIFFGDFRYIVGGCAYSLSAIHNGILRGNQRPPYNLTKPFGTSDKRSKVALPYPEPLIHFALVSGSKCGPALRCYSPKNIDQELVEAARNFLRNGGIFVDAETKVLSVSKILRWFSVDFGKNEVEVMKHAANYLEPSKSAELLELLADTHLKVTYQTYDWELNY